MMYVFVDKSENFLYTKHAGRSTLYTRVSELAFKRSVRSPGTREPPLRRLFYVEENFYGYLYFFR